MMPLQMVDASKASLANVAKEILISHGFHHGERLEGAFGGAKLACKRFWSGKRRALYGEPPKRPDKREYRDALVD